jgi:hypothetical protein
MLFLIIRIMNNLNCWHNLIVFLLDFGLLFVFRSELIYLVNETGKLRQVGDPNLETSYGEQARRVDELYPDYWPTRTVTSCRRTLSLLLTNQLRGFFKVNSIQLSVLMIRLSTNINFYSFLFYFDYLKQFKCFLRQFFYDDFYMFEKYNLKTHSFISALL